MAEKKIRVLVIDDEVAIRRFLKASFDPEEIDFMEAETGQEGLRLIATWNPEMVLLDLGLPDIDGIEVTRRLREWSEVPIIVLSARGQEEDKVAALDAGADDYVTKPFGVSELMARIRVALRHVKWKEHRDPVFESGDLRVDLSSRQVFKAGTEIRLTALEYKLLAVLVKHSGKVVTHRHLLNDVWGAAYVNDTHYLRIYMGQLRAKLEDDPARPKIFLTESGVGYRLKSE